MRRPYEPVIECESSTGQFSTNDPDPVRGPDGFIMRPPPANPTETIRTLLFESLREATPGPRTPVTRQVPEHLRRYVRP